MLKKLFKYDFQAACRIFLVLYGIVACLTVLGKIIFTLVPEGLENMPILSALVPTYILLMVGLVIGFEIFLIVRFYRSLYTDEGYLYHTLPVKPWQLILSKLFVNVLLSFLGFVIIILCGLILLAGGPMESILSHKDEIYEVITIVFGTSPTEFILFMLPYMVIAQFNSYLMYFASIALGQIILPKHRVLGAFVAYMIYYMVLQVITTVPTFAFAFSSIDDILVESDFTNWFNTFYHFMYFFSIGLALVGSVVFFSITNHLMKKKLNLD